MMTANPAFAPKRRRPYTETPEFAAMLRRLLRAYRRRVGSGDIESLSEMAAMAAELDDVIHDAVTGLIDRGYSYTDVAERLGITRQAAWQRFGRKSPMRRAVTALKRAETLLGGSS
jgi:hypothetical protein